MSTNTQEKERAKYLCNKLIGRVKRMEEESQGYLEECDKYVALFDTLAETAYYFDKYFETQSREIKVRLLQERAKTGRDHCEEQIEKVRERLKSAEEINNKLQGYPSPIYLGYSSETIDELWEEVRLAELHRNDALEVTKRVKYCLSRAGSMFHHKLYG